MPHVLPRRARRRPPVVVLSESVQELALTAFVADNTLTPADLIAALTYTLGIFVVANEDGTRDPSANSEPLDAAIAGLRRVVADARELDRIRRRVQ